MFIKFSAWRFIRRVILKHPPPLARAPAGAFSLAPGTRLSI